MGPPRALKKAAATALAGAEALLGAEALADAVEVLQVGSGRHLIAVAISVARRDTSSSSARTKRRNKELLLVNTIRYTLV